VKRKGTKDRPRQVKAPVVPKPPSGSASVLPMEIQVGDRFTDHGFEWEVLTHPAVLRGGKSLRARIRRPGLPEIEREVTWAAHERVEIQAGSQSES
jgi:hypothetical protein